MEFIDSISIGVRVYGGWNYQVAPAWVVGVEGDFAYMEGCSWKLARKLGMSERNLRQLRWSNTALRRSDLAVHYLKERNLLYPRFVAAWLS